MKDGGFVMLATITVGQEETAIIIITTTIFIL